MCRDAKAHCAAKNLAEQISNVGALRSVKCNANGSQVSILISQVTDRLISVSVSLIIDYCISSSTCGVVFIIPGSSILWSWNYMTIYYQKMSTGSSVPSAVITVIPLDLLLAAGK